MPVRSLKKGVYGKFSKNRSIPTQGGLYDRSHDFMVMNRHFIQSRGLFPSQGWSRQAVNLRHAVNLLLTAASRKRRNFTIWEMGAVAAVSYMTKRKGMQQKMTNLLLEVNGLKKYFPIKGSVLGRKVGDVKAVDDVSFSVREGEILGLVGESGCGKSTTGKSILRLSEPTAGEVKFQDQDIISLNAEDMRKLRRNMQIIFQDPYASLNPRHTVEKIIGEPLLVYGMKSAKERKERIKELLEVVGLQPHHASRYSHQFSGGQRQRIGIARALANNPKLIICDEPVSALDVSVQSQILNLMEDLQKKFNLTYIF